MTQEKKRGPKPKPLRPWRPQLRLDADTLEAAQRLGVDAMSEIVTWAIPRWNERSHPAAQDAQESRVVLRPLGAEGREPVQVHFDPALRVQVVYWLSRDDDLKAQVVKLGYLWEPARRRYERPHTERMGNPVDRVAQTAAALYHAGYPVELPSRAVAGIVVRGEYRVERERWVSLMADGSFLLTWEYGGDAVYAATNDLRGARWSKADQGTVVPRHAFADLRDFAAAWGFSVSDAAHAALVTADLDAQRELVGVVLAAPIDLPVNSPASQAPSREVSIPDHLRLDD
ncbi:hypothetical protein [Deinococcus sp. 12RED42]|uniref:hypothetical protein n=1 Tax=Deinococcus sp. 12RED42 TaxID=2745872 RepID=UPI001E37E75E|nr:hypothetical protein [Deinococcus sp. 12RED42]MCD0164979.1 hypothetical protein [Deinococcus sp. 12RED42]